MLHAKKKGGNSRTCHIVGGIIADAATDTDRDTDADGVTDTDTDFDHHHHHHHHVEGCTTDVLVLPCGLTVSESIGCVKIEMQKYHDL